MSFLNGSTSVANGYALSILRFHLGERYLNVLSTYFAWWWPGFNLHQYMATLTLLRITLKHRNGSWEVYGEAPEQDKKESIGNLIQLFLSVSCSVGYNIEIWIVILLFNMFSHVGRHYTVLKAYSYICVLGSLQVVLQKLWCQNWTPVGLMQIRHHIQYTMSLSLLPIFETIFCRETNPLPVACCQ